MLPSTPITTLFLDIGGVLLTNGWDRHARQRAAEAFSLDSTEMKLGIPFQSASAQPVSATGPAGP